MDPNYDIPTTVFLQDMTEVIKRKPTRFTTVPVLWKILYFFSFKGGSILTKTLLDISIMLYQNSVSRVLF